MPDTHGDKSVILPSNERNENRNSTKMPFCLSSVCGLIIPLGPRECRPSAPLPRSNLTVHADIILIRRADPVILRRQLCQRRWSEMQTKLLNNFAHQIAHNQECRSSSPTQAACNVGESTSTARLW